MSLRIAVVQPEAHAPPGDERNIDDAVRMIEAAAREGADFVTFPESYPGPWRMPAAFDPTPRMTEAARRYGMHVVYGTLEPIDMADGTAYNVIMMAYPSDREPAVYRRNHPNGPWIYSGGKQWDFEYVTGDEYPIFETEHATVGLAMCSEVYMPEVSRALALRGAEIIFMPAGIDKLKLWPTWRNLIWSRAIENLALVVTTQNLLQPTDRGLAMVAAPESIVFEATAAGIFVVTVDLDRIRELRNAEDDLTSSRTDAAKAGVLSPQWQRPEMWSAVHTALR